MHMLTLVCMEDLATSSPISYTYVCMCVCITNSHHCTCITTEMPSPAAVILLFFLILGCVIISIYVDIEN